MYICEVNDIDRYRERHSQGRQSLFRVQMDLSTELKKKKKEKKAEKDREENNLP